MKKNQNFHNAIMTFIRFTYFFYDSTKVSFVFYSSKLPTGTIKFDL